VNKQDEQNNSFIRRVIESKANGRKLNSLADVEFDREDLIVLVRDFWRQAMIRLPQLFSGPCTSLANNPDVQIRLQTEIDDVVGRDRQPLLEDESKMPYTQAVILETLRLHSPVPLSLLRATTCDTVLGDYFIPARTTVRLYTSVFNFSDEQDLIV
jgi:hypothetical protein